MYTCKVIHFCCLRHQLRTWHYYSSILPLNLHELKSSLNSLGSFGLHWTIKLLCVLKKKLFFLSKWKDNHWCMWFSQTLECKSLWSGYFPFLLSKNWSAVSSNFTTLWIVPEGYTFYSRNTWLSMFFGALLAENRNNLDTHQLMIG